MAVKRNMTAKTGDDGAMANLTRLQQGFTEIEIRGTAPYISNQWSEKAKRMMPGHPDKPQLSEQKGVRKPKDEAEAGVHRLPDGRVGLPATAMKAAMVGAVRFFAGLTMVESKLLFYVIGEAGGPEPLIPITYAGEPVLREDTVRNSNGGADLRYRYEFREWKAAVAIRFIASKITADSLVNLLDAAGLGGIGDWRPSSPKSATGTFGTWEVVTNEDEATP